MKLTETMLRKMIQEERRNLQSKRKPINESFSDATEGLYRAMEEFLESHMHEFGHEDPRRACDKLEDEVSGFCEGFIGEFQDDEY